MSANSVFVLSELICPQICFIHGLTSSASQALNNWRNYQARGSKAPQKCVMPLSKACRKGKKKKQEKEGPPNSELCGRTTQPSNVPPTYKDTHRKLKHRGWWCHKWQALTGRISIAHNSGSPCMSDKFMIPSKSRSPIFLCIRMGVFWSRKISPCSLASVPHTKNVTDATLISEQRDWHNYSAQFQGYEVATSVSISHCSFTSCSTFSEFSFRSNKTLQKGGEMVPFKSVTHMHTGDLLLIF